MLDLLDEQLVYIQELVDGAHSHLAKTRVVLRSMKDGDGKSAGKKKPS